MQYDKPFKSHDELIDLLIEKNLKIEENERDDIKNILSSMNYYSIINAYKDIFIVKENEKEVFPKELTFWDIFKMYEYDKSVQRITFHYIMMIENSFKTKLSYIIAKNYGVQQPIRIKSPNSNTYYNLTGSYLDPCNFTSYKSVNFFRDISKSIYKTPNYPTKYYREGEVNKPPKNHIPPWIAFQNLSFYYISEMCKSLKANEKNDLGMMFKSVYDVNNRDVSYSHIMDMLGIVYEFRNQLAHGHRFYNFKTKRNFSLKRKYMNKLYSKVLSYKDEYKYDIGKKDFYAFLISIVTLLNNRALANEFLGELRLIQIEFNNDETLLQATKLPEDYLDRLYSIYK